jgi:hypothetical protein
VRVQLISARRRAGLTANRKPRAPSRSAVLAGGDLALPAEFGWVDPRRAQPRRAAGALPRLELRPRARQPTIYAGGRILSKSASISRKSGTISESRPSSRAVIRAASWICSTRSGESGWGASVPLMWEPHLFAPSAHLCGRCWPGWQRR